MRHSIGKLVGLAAAIGLAVGTFGSSSIASARAAKGSEEQASQTDPGAAYEQVDSFTLLTKPYSFHAVDRDTVIVWTTPFQAYLVELSFPVNDLKFANAIGVTSFGSRVYAKFDSVQVRGFRYPIHAIYKMSRDEARNLERAS